jgi:hypothetical protein
MGRAKIQYKFAEIPQGWKGRLKFRLKYVEVPGEGGPKIGCPHYRVLARILDLGRVSNDQGVHMSITLNSQNHGSSYARQQQTMPVAVLCFATKYKASIRSYCALTLEY